MSVDVTPDASISFSAQVAEEIRVILARRRIRQAQIARQLGVSEQWISVRLRGVQPIDLNDLYAIALALDVTVFDLIPKSAGQSDVTARYDDSDDVKPTGRKSSRTRPGGPYRPANVPAASRRPSFLRQPISV